MKTIKTFKIKYMLSLSLAVLMMFTACDSLFDDDDDDNVESVTIRIASFNASLNRGSQGELVTDLSTPGNEQAKKVAEIIQRKKPDVLALLEFDYDKNGDGLRLFQENYLSVSQNGADTIFYKYAYIPSSNTGELASVDLDGNGSVSIPGDAYGFGFYPGQYAFVLLSKYKIKVEDVRTFQSFLWKDMPEAMLPKNEDGSSYYSDDALAVFRLSSKNHVDIPIELPNKKIVHAIIAHPTPPVFDGPEDRNGTRNHDEIRFLNDYVSNEEYMYDDNGNKGGIGETDYFVIMGDMNADSFDGDATGDPISLFEVNEKINQSVLTGSLVPKSDGGAEAAVKQGEANTSHKGNPSYDTGDFSDGNPGNLRVDYVLPSAKSEIVKTGVFWPTDTDSYSYLNDASDHKMVWMDLKY